MLVVLGFKQPKDNIAKRKQFMSYPNDTSKLWWDVFISLVLLISVFSTPLDVAFPQLSKNIAGFKYFQDTIDILFGIDIFVTFNAAI